MRGILKIFIFAIAMLLPCMMVGQEVVGKISGHVVDSINNEPIPFTVVVLDSISTTTNFDGYFVFDSIANGNYTLMAYYPRYQEYKSEINTDTIHSDLTLRLKETEEPFQDSFSHEFSNISSRLLFTLNVDTIKSYDIYFTKDYIDTIEFLSSYIRVYKNWYLGVPAKNGDFSFVKYRVTKSSYLFESLNNSFFNAEYEVDNRVIKMYNMQKKQVSLFRKIGVSRIKIKYDKPKIRMRKKFQEFIAAHPEYVYNE